MIEIDISKQLYGVNGKFTLKFDIQIPQGEFLAITGSSGSGKTTILRILAGLEKGNGTIKVDNQIWLNNQKSLPPQKREVGFLFQSYALFPHMTVLENLLYVKKDLELANYLLEITDLTNMQNRYPQSLSGGQKQRVALARAVIGRPKILCLDEPFSAIDYRIKDSLQKKLLSLHQEFKITTIMVTHNFQEIEEMADKMVILENGLIVENIMMRSPTKVSNINKSIE